MLMALGDASPLPGFDLATLRRAAAVLFYVVATPNKK
jgi:hypothetical protein